MSSAEFQDYYAILGVRKTANISEIKKKFRQLALKYHPDRNQGNKVAEAKFKEISEAYDVLSDEDKRTKYHHFGQYWQKDVSTEHTTSRSTNNHSTTNSKVDFNSTDFSQYSNFDEFINELLGRFSSPSSSSTSSANSSQNSNFPGFSQTETSSFVDDEASINLTYAEAFRGITKKLNLEQEIVEIRIPAGVKPNSRIRLAGKGKPSISGGSRDLYLKIKLNPHAFFSFEGDDLVCEVPITPDEAVLGSSINVPTPDGMVSMKIPAGINSGQVLRLRDKGWISPQGNRTDQLVKIVVETPQKINAQEKEYYEKIRDLRLENPRSNLERISL